MYSFIIYIIRNFCDKLILTLSKPDEKIYSERNVKNVLYHIFIKNIYIR